MARSLIAVVANCGRTRRFERNRVPSLGAPVPVAVITDGTNNTVSIAIE